MWYDKLTGMGHLQLAWREFQADLLDFPALPLLLFRYKAKTQRNCYEPNGVATDWARYASDKRAERSQGPKEWDIFIF